MAKSSNSPDKVSSKGFTITVTAAAPLHDFLRQKLTSHSKSSIKMLLSRGCICLNNSTIVTRHDHCLQPGDRVTILSAKQHKLQFSHPQLRIIYEDNFIIVVEKSVGLLSVSAPNEQEHTAFNIVDQYLKRSNGSHRAYVVNRLDRETSGVMLFAKTRGAQMELRLRWNDNVLQRNYIAVVEGELAQTNGTLDTYLYEDPQTFVHSSPVAIRGSQRAITHYKVLSANGLHTLVGLSLETGRTNQIRVHMSSIGHPVVGDMKYGSSSNPVGRMCLHAQKLQIIHPITHKTLTFEVPTPKCFYKLVE